MMKNYILNCFNFSLVSCIAHRHIFGISFPSNLEAEAAAFCKSVCVFFFADLMQRAACRWQQSVLVGQTVIRRTTTRDGSAAAAGGRVC